MLYHTARSHIPPSAHPSHRAAFRHAPDAVFEDEPVEMPVHPRVPRQRALKEAA